MNIIHSFLPPTFRITEDIIRVDWLHLNWLLEYLHYNEVKICKYLSYFTNFLVLHYNEQKMSCGGEGSHISRTAKC